MNSIGDKIYKNEGVQQETNDYETCFFREKELHLKNNSMSPHILV